MMFGASRWLDVIPSGTAIADAATAASTTPPFLESLGLRMSSS
jgi:hypothetical protein